MGEILLLNNKNYDMLKDYMPKDNTLKKIAEFFNSFSDLTRVKIITALCVTEMCVNDLSIVLNLNQTTVSHQLKLLKASGIVDCTRFGKIMYYKIINDSINDIISSGVDYLLVN